MQAQHDLNNNSAKVNFSGPTEVLIPSSEELVLNLKETIALDWELYSLAAPDRPMRPLIHWSETDQLDGPDLRTMPFGSTFIQWAFPGKPTSTVRLAAPGFHPQTLLIHADESGVDKRRVNMEPLEPMRIRFDDQRTEKFGQGVRVETRASIPAFDEFSFGENQVPLNLEEQQEIDYFGLYPNAGVGVSADGLRGSITPHRFLFTPGGEITIVISDKAD